MRNVIVTILLAVMLSGCSVVGGDLDKTIYLAEKYGKPQVAKCASYLRQALDKDMALMAEDTDGLISLAFKYYLMQESSPEAEEAFKRECSEVAIGILLQARKVIRN